MIPSLESLCQDSLVNSLKTSDYHHRMINYLCKFLPNHMLEPILERLLANAAITDVALTMFLVPTRTRLIMNGFSQIKNSVFKQIGFNCPNLVELNLSDCFQVSNSVVRAVLQGCPALEELRLDRCHRVTDAVFDPNQSPFNPLLGCLSLTTISLQGCPQMTGELVPHLNKLCINLKYLNLSQCKHVKCSTIQLLFEHPKLQSLNLSFIDDMTDEALDPSDPEIFVSSRSYPLEDYVYDEDEEGEEGAAAGGEAADGGGFVEEVQWKTFETNDQQVVASASPLYRTNVHTEAAAAATALEGTNEPSATLGGLKETSPSGISVPIVSAPLGPVRRGPSDSSGGSTSTSSNVPSNTTSSGASSSVTVVASAAAAAFPIATTTVLVKQAVLRRRKSPLHTLILAKSKITDEGLRKMTFLTSLQDISLPWCGDITDHGISLLVSRCPRLRSIDLKSCNITDSSVSAIAKGCKDLKQLDISWCSGVTDAGIKDLAPAIPSTSLDAAIKVAKAARDAAAASAGTAAAGRTIFHVLPHSNTEEDRASASHGTASAYAIDSGSGGGNEWGFSSTDATATATTVSSYDDVDGHLPQPPHQYPSQHQSSGMHIYHHTPVSVTEAPSSSSSSSSSSSTSSANIGTNARVFERTHVVDTYVSDEDGWSADSEDRGAVNLESLSIVWCSSLGDGALAALATLPKLKLIEASGCGGLSEEVADVLRHRRDQIQVNF